MSYPVAAKYSPLETSAFPGTACESLLPTVFEYDNTSAILLYKSFCEFSSFNCFEITTLIFPDEATPVACDADSGTNSVIMLGLYLFDSVTNTFFLASEIYSLPFESTNFCSPFTVV